MAETDRADDPRGDIANSIVAIVLAAGAGSRFSGDVHKLLAPLGGSTVIGSSLSNVLTAGFSKVIVVTGAASLPDALITDSRLLLVHNGRWSQGQASSLQVGIDAARTLGADAVVVGLGDQPFIEPEAWRRVAAAESPIAIASYAGRRGHPVKLDRSVWKELPAEGDFGARDLILMRPDKVSQVDCPGSATDIDTQEDLEQWT
ncbi:MAG: NTP transferase domain-containing protein [Actinomycetota bacterium]